MIVPSCDFSAFQVVRESSGGRPLAGRPGTKATPFQSTPFHQVPLYVSSAKAWLTKPQAAIKARVMRTFMTTPLWSVGQGAARLNTFGPEEEQDGSPGPRRPSHTAGGLLSRTVNHVTRPNLGASSRPQGPS